MVTAYWNALEQDPIRRISLLDAWIKLCTASFETFSKYDNNEQRDTDQDFFFLALSLVAFSLR